MALDKNNMNHVCHCEWCTTPTNLHENYSINLPTYIRFGQGKNCEESAIAIMYDISGEDVHVLFPDGSKFTNLTSAGKYAHTKLLKLSTSDGNNGWKRWRINMKFLDGTEKPVPLKIIKEAKVSIENKSVNFEDLIFKSNFCRCSNEKCATKTILNLLMKQPVKMKRKQINNVVSKIVKKKKTNEINDSEMDCDPSINEDDTEDEDEKLDLDNFVIDSDNIPGDKYYNQVVYGRKYISFSNITEDVEDERFFVCTILDKFVNVKIPKCVLLALYQYQKCESLSCYR